MPKIEVQEQAFYTYLGEQPPNPELEELLTVAKAELDEPADEQGIVKFELNDTNRPDLWSSAGLARQLRVFRGGRRPRYDFFSTPSSQQESGQRRVVVDPGLKERRPYVAGFAVTGRPIDAAALDDLIQTQEKLCWNYGRKRSSIAMGIYRSDLIVFPVHYVAAEPQTQFQPLGLDETLTMREILSTHPKGQEFGRIVAEFDKMPLLTDDNGGVLSFPPIINSARIGAVEEGDSNLFIELTGTDMPSLQLACSIVACDLADAGYEIQPARVEYPYDTPLGREVVTPFYFQEPQQVELDYLSRLLGRELSADEVVDGLARMGIEATVEGSRITVSPPPYRNDFLHAVDIVEDAMIGCGMDSFSPEAPSDFTVGRLTPEEHFAREVKWTLVGLGYQEMLFNYLGSRREFLELMYDESEWPAQEESLVRIANPMSENYEYVRNSVIPHLLESESISANAVYPHYIFEIGKVAIVDERENYGSRTENRLGFLAASEKVDFNTVNAHVAALMYYVLAEHELQETEDGRFIPGRVARLVVNGSPVGLFGEVHPKVLAKWGIQAPCVAGEIDLDALLRAR
jgi:phenylalanyl-tRNA synthetase beta chain